MPRNASNWPDSDSMRATTLVAGLALLAACAQAPKPATAPAPAQTAAPKRESDEYTRYELLDPESARFRILFEVTAIEPGAAFYFNPIRKGSEASDESVRDLATSQTLPLEVVSGEAARTSGLPDADLDGCYIRIRLPRPVPREGEVRLLIDKTYRDPQSYMRKGSDR